MFSTLAYKGKGEVHLLFSTLEYKGKGEVHLLFSTLAYKGMGDVYLEPNCSRHWRIKERESFTYWYNILQTYFPTNFFIG